MKRIGIYDSGIGGLTTLAKLYLEFSYCDFLYYSDNLHFPLGTSDCDEVKSAVANAVAYLEKSCDIVVLACNTASSCTQNKNVYKLLPPLNDFSPKTTLVLATPNTLKKLKVKEKGFQTLATEHLANLITDLHSQTNDRQVETLEKIYELLLPQIKNKKFESVVIGCSHYVLIEDIIKGICKKTELFDGNEKLINELQKMIEPHSITNNVNIDSADIRCIDNDRVNVECTAVGSIYTERVNVESTEVGSTGIDSVDIGSTDIDSVYIGKVDFIFTGETQIELYVAILEKLLSSYHKTPN